MAECDQGFAEAQFLIWRDGKMPVADRAAQRPEPAVASDEGGGGGVGTFDHPDATEIGELTGPAVHISDKSIQCIGQRPSDRGAVLNYRAAELAAFGASNHKCHEREAVHDFARLRATRQRLSRFH